MLLLYPAASGARSITSVGVGQGADGSVRTPYSRSDCRNIGFSMNDGVLSEWLVQDGCQAVEGQPLFSLESDKSVQEVEAPASGTLKIVAQVGEVYPVGTVLAEII